MNHDRVHVSYRLGVVLTIFRVSHSPYLQVCLFVGHPSLACPGVAIVASVALWEKSIIG